MDRETTDQGYRQVLDHLAHAIEEGTYAPGGRLPTERQLAEQFGVGRGVTRRALAALEAQGLIRRHVGRGTFVTPASNDVLSSPIAPGDISPVEHIEARLRFEPELALMVVTNATAEDLNRMEECLRRSESASGREQFELWDAAFHKGLAAATHNKLVIAMYDLIHAVRQETPMWAMRKQSEAAPQPDAYRREHRAILEALRRRDAEAARELLVAHLRNTRRRILDY